MLGSIEMNGKRYAAEKKLVCRVINGVPEDYGVPIVAEPNASNKRFAKLYGIQFGLMMKQISENLFITQFGEHYTVRDYE